MILRFGGELSARFSVEERFIEKDVRAVQKFVNAMTQLKLTGLLDVDETQHGKKLFSAVTDVKGLSELKERFKDVIDDLCEIAERFGLQLRMASAIDNETLESIPMLLELARTGRYQVDLSNVSVTLAKVTDEEKFMAGLSSENSVKFDLQQFTAPGRILGKEVELGPCSIVCPRAVIKNSDDARRRYLAAKDGEGIVLEFGVLSPAQILLATV